MDVLTVIIDSSGANIPYIHLMEQLQASGIRSHMYVIDDLREYIGNHDLDAMIDPFNLGSFSRGHEVYKSADNALRLLLATRKLMSNWIPSVMSTLDEAVRYGRVNPKNTLVISNSPGLLYLGHYLLEKGFGAFMCMEPYRVMDWHGKWQQDRSHVLPDYLPPVMAKGALRLMFSSHGKQMAQQFLGKSLGWSYQDIAGAISHHVHMYSPQLAHDKHITSGYPYPSTNDVLGNPLAEFLDSQKAHNRRVFAFTIGSMAIDTEHKDRLVEQFVEGIRILPGTAGIVLGHKPQRDDRIIAVDSFVPYNVLFPQIDLIVTHGGSGTTHLALFSGTPVLSMPFVKDQYDYARRLDDLGMSVGTIPKNRFTASRFVSAVSNNLNPAVVEAARKAGEIEHASSRNGLLVQTILKATQQTAPQNQARLMTHLATR